MDVLQGTLDLLILRTLESASLHGVGIADRIEQVTRGVFVIGPGSLFPALHRLADKGWIEGEWTESDSKRRVKTYTLTAAGRAQLSQENGLDPLPEQIAAACNIDVNEVIDLLGVIEQPVSLDAPVDDEARYSLADTLEDSTTPAPAETASQHLLGEELHRALALLTPRERSVITLRYGIGDGRSRTLLEVGKELGISRERVRQLEVVALMKLRSISGNVALRECV